VRFAALRGGLCEPAEQLKDVVVMKLLHGIAVGRQPGSKQPREPARSAMYACGDAV
jgi:hypothetical protein